MTVSKRVVHFILIIIFGFSLAAGGSLALARPSVSIQQEDAAHPRLVKAVRSLEAALMELREAPHDFGGNKAAAMEDTQRAIHSLKKALYYRLKIDDAAIDRIK